MKKEYSALFKLRYEPNQWRNALHYLDGSSKRTTLELEEAKAALEAVKKHFPGVGHTTTDYSAGFGVTTEIDNSTAYKMTVIETLIRSREVTEWEVVEENK